MAINNLRDSGDEAFELVAPGLLQARDQDPAQLLLTDVIRRQKVNGDHIAMVPDGVSLFLTGSEDAEGLANMANFAERLTKGRLSLSGIPLRLNGDVWVAFLPSHLHASYRQFERLRAETVVQDYSDQQLPLQAMLDPKSKRVFVSPLSFLPLAKKQSSLTCCDWVSGINVLLPKADLIRFVLSENKADHTIAAITEWDHAVNIVGNLMVPQGLYPERYRVSSFPTAAQMAKLKSASKYSS